MKVEILVPVAHIFTYGTYKNVSDSAAQREF